MVQCTSHSSHLMAHTYLHRKYQAMYTTFYASNSVIEGKSFLDSIQIHAADLKESKLVTNACLQLLKYHHLIWLVNRYLFICNHQNTSNLDHRNYWTPLPKYFVFHNSQNKVLLVLTLFQYVMVMRYCSEQSYQNWPSSSMDTKEVICGHCGISHVTFNVQGCL